MLEAICRLDAVEAIEHQFDGDKSTMYAIGRSMWRFVEPGWIGADPGRAMWGMLEYSTSELLDG